MPALNEKDIDFLDKLLTVLTDSQLDALIEGSVRAYCKYYDMKLVPNPRKGNSSG